MSTVGYLQTGPEHIRQENTADCVGGPFPPVGEAMTYGIVQQGMLDAELCA